MLEADDVAASQITKLLVHFYKKICTIILHLSYSIDIILTKYVLTSISIDYLLGSEAKNIIMVQPKMYDNFVYYYLFFYRLSGIGTVNIKRWHGWRIFIE